MEATTLREGAEGRAWLDGLPALVDNACGRWRCAIDGPPQHGQVALIVPIHHPRGPAMLKVSYPHPGNLGEALGLATFGGRGSVELFEVDDTRLVLVLERASPQTLTDYAVRPELVEEAIEIAGDLARRLAVKPLPGVTALAETTTAWIDELTRQTESSPWALPQAAIDQAQETIEQLATDTTATMLHGDLHFDNILRSTRDGWLSIDPKGWSGTGAFDTFTVIAGRREEIDQGPGLYQGIVRRINRFAAAAGIDPDHALACCQARAVSSYYYQQQVPGNWFDLKFLEVLALSGGEVG
ncbi:streptomycin 6-kinase [Friedmanniella luteola]|uniref:Streptomycin 6-kinase n=1 Tax=Friedmanniella luteola TaxID=546871 RepID=A0A1H1WNI8_9ACTN|nr:streptomycin 6-kinase [Friedmanniella luteola]